ncbi:hypothetical protein NET03_01925 [Thermomicrobium sp. CFH 73360]|uniref:hypothetical protein n=1 Tax=Thermomicrobium sp. CFH 73360 TaxID=2951987 RepID=UPI0020766DBB|nr:hypothetical protein [Thermomicrobium sp. CFH 73360]MCM8745283.1 hypothetical protein [Thermomicrobium sp. CFH 73360]
MTGFKALTPRPEEQREQMWLEELGFTPEQIARLRELRDMYPYIEYMDSRKQWNRLRFVKWLYSRGEIPR